MGYATIADKAALEETPFLDRISVNNVYEVLSETAAQHASRAAISFQIKSGEKD